MPFEITASGPDIDDGVTPALLENVEEDTGKWGKMRKWTFLVETPTKSEPVTPLTVYTSGNTSPTSKSYQFLTALLGKAPLVGERFEDPTGTRVLATIARNDKGFPTISELAPFTEPQQVLPGVPR